MPRPTPRPYPHAGFTLMELAAVIAIIAVITAATFSMGSSMIESARRVNTNNKLDAIETALTAFRLANNRLPCPGDATLTDIPANSATFGYEAANLGSCIGGSPAANSIYTVPVSGTASAAGGTTVAEGAVPVKALGLPDEFQLDGWGRKFSYAVWTPMTAINAFVTYGVNPNCGAITVENAGHGNRTTAAAYALVSYGPDGHGGYLKSGTRMSSGSDNADELTNCHCTGNLAGNPPFAATYVEREVTQANPNDSNSAFDDIVRFKDRWQMQNAYDTYVPSGRSCTDGFRINGNLSQTSILGIGFNVAHGDVNCDGIQDLILSAPLQNPNPGYVYVIFGTQSGFPNPLPVNNLNGTNGISITDGSSDGFGKALAVGDIDNDGCDDIVVGSNSDIYIMYGRSALKGGGAAYDVESIASGGNTCQATDFWSTSGLSAPVSGIAIGDVNGDGLNDLIMSDGTWSSSKGRVYVMFGIPNTCTGPGHSPGSPTYAYGFDPTKLKHSTTPKGLVVNGPTASACSNGMGDEISLGDIDNDGRKDIIAADSCYNLGHGRVYVIFGQTAATWGAADVISAGGLVTNGSNTVSGGTIATPAGFIIDQSTANTYIGAALATGDVTGDSLTDLVVGSATSGGPGAGVAYVIKGMNNANWQSYGTGPFIASTMVTDGKAVKIANSHSLGDWVGVGDINRDGTADILLGDVSATANGSAWALFGGAAITGTINLDSQPPTGDSGALPGVRFDCPASANGNCAQDISVVDLNNDGIGDAVICSQNGNVSGSNEEGWCYVLYGKKSGWTTPYSLGTIY